MIEKDINGLVFNKLPKPRDGRYRFNVMEVYVGYKRNGKDLTVSYFRYTNATNIMFKEIDDKKYEMYIKPDTFKELEIELSRKLPHEIKIYPNFEEI